MGDTQASPSKESILPMIARQKIRTLMTYIEEWKSKRMDRGPSHWKEKREERYILWRNNQRSGRNDASKRRNAWAPSDNRIQERTTRVHKWRNRTADGVYRIRANHLPWEMRREEDGGYPINAIPEGADVYRARV